MSPSCAANELASIVVEKTSAFANQKIANFRRQISIDEKQVALDQSGAGARRPLGDRPARCSSSASRTTQQDQLSTSQLLLQATQVEAPKILTGATAQKITARSRRNTVVVAALIGLIIGAIAALMWDGVAAGMSRRRGE